MKHVESNVLVDIYGVETSSTHLFDDIGTTSIVVRKMFELIWIIKGCIFMDHITVDQVQP